MGPYLLVPDPYVRLTVAFHGAPITPQGRMQGRGAPCMSMCVRACVGHMTESGLGDLGGPGGPSTASVVGVRCGVQAAWLV